PPAGSGTADPLPTPPPGAPPTYGTPGGPAAPAAPTAGARDDIVRAVHAARSRKGIESYLRHLATVTGEGEEVLAVALGRHERIDTLAAVTDRRLILLSHRWGAPSVVPIPREAIAQVRQQAGLLHAALTVLPAGPPGTPPLEVTHLDRNDARTIADALLRTAPVAPPPTGPFTPVGATGSGPSHASPFPPSGVGHPPVSPGPVPVPVPAYGPPPGAAAPGPVTPVTPATPPTGGPLGGKPDDERRPADRRYVVLDCETTGLNAAQGDRIVSLALVTVDGGRVVDRWSSLCNPERDTGAVHIHGIDNATARRAPLFPALVPEILRRLDGETVAAHNVGFDLFFLASELERAGVPWRPGRVLDTLDLAQRFMPRLRNHRLATCAKALGIPHHAHRADSDAEVTTALLLHLLDRAEEEGHADPASLTVPGIRVLRRARRRSLRCDAEAPALSRRHRDAHRTVEAWPESTAVWRQALGTLQREDCPEAGRLLARFGVRKAGSPDPADGPVADEALRTAIDLHLAGGVPDRDDLRYAMEGLARADAERRTPERLLALFPEPAATIARLPGCGDCAPCEAGGRCVTGSPAAALVSHFTEAGQRADMEELARYLPLIHEAGERTVLGRAARHVGQAREKAGREDEAAELWRWAVDRGARDGVLLNRLSMHHERRRKDDAAALAICELALDGPLDGGGSSAREAIEKRAERCRKRLARAASS
ncbi:exonuclease domain-containing protein, partial [Streptomyces calidiresistens]|uniref:exonuclease domain-containing protein n=1 Tax=Streptomyces calidiresistens TaxID=1485586 RepID=UPI00225E202C